MNYQNGSFIKIRNITIAYQLPQITGKKWSLSNARIYLQALNPGLIYSKVDWIDPDLRSAASNRGFAIGVNLGF